MLATRKGVPKTKRYDLWKALTRDGKAPQHTNSSIAASWKRSLKAGLSPIGGNVPEVLSEAETHALLQRNSLLLQAFQSNLQILEKGLAEFPRIILLTDPEGKIIHLSGHDSILNPFEELGIQLAGDVSEETRGTTAPGIVIREKKPATVLQEDHFSQMLHWCCCTASPIVDYRGELLGSLNITTPSLYSSHINLLVCLALGASKSIQYDVRISEHLNEIVTIKEAFGGILNCLHEPVIVADKSGVISHTNRMACQLLGTSPDFLMGRHCYEIIKSDSISKCLNKEIMASGKAHVVGSRGQQRLLSVRAEPLHNRFDCFSGAAIIFKEEKKKWKLQTDEILSPLYTIHDILGESNAITKAVRLARIFARSDMPILLHGETGTGKEVFAQAIHNLSPRRGKPFVPVNCAAIPNALAESELFGYQKGAFTGATESGKKGKFEMADGGTIFLDEINSMPLELQGKLLRAIDSGEIVQLGSHKYKHVNVRIIAAMNVSLEGRNPPPSLRNDLFYRIATALIFLPPLSERLEDIEELAFFFIRRACKMADKKFKQIDQGAIKILKSHRWPGNIRELRSCMDFAVAVSRTEIIGVEDLPDYLTRRVNESYDAPMSATDIMNVTERKMIEEALAECQGRVGAAAKRLGLSRSTFYRRCKKYDIIKSKSSQ